VETVLLIKKLVGVYGSTPSHLLSFGTVRMEGRIRIDFQNTTNKIIVINFLVVISLFHGAFFFISLNDKHQHNKLRTQQ